MAAAAYEYGRHVGIAYQLVSDLQVLEMVCVCVCVCVCVRARVCV